MTKVNYKLIITLCAVFLSISTNLYSQQLSSKGLVAFYPFNSNANDESGNGNDGIVNGATLTTDRFDNENSAYIFDGQDDYIHIPFSEDFDFDPSGQFTLVVWANTNVLDVSHHIVTKGPSNTVWDYGLTIDNNNLYLFGHHSQHEAYSTTQAQTNSWHMVVGVYDNANWKIYIDGVLENDNTASSITQSSGGIAIGRKGETELGYFNVKIDDCKLYNHALSVSEINS
ncbi:MAG: LamG domain-containing protein, partial [Bacteroidales bacterium]|nr:LamG domain-containing protein [Bacteroidales bacterium]